MVFSAGNENYGEIRDNLAMFPRTHRNIQNTYILSNSLRKEVISKLSLPKHFVPVGKLTKIHRM